MAEPYYKLQQMLSMRIWLGKSVCLKNVTIRVASDVCVLEDAPVPFQSFTSEYAEVWWQPRALVKKYRPGLKALKSSPMYYAQGEKVSS